MNDNELDGILDEWRTPPVPSSLADRVRAGFAARRRRGSFFTALRRWIAVHPRSLAACAVAAILTLLVAVPNAHPQAASAPPWTVDSEFLNYAEDGSSSVEMLMTSYMLNGNETILSRWAPSNPLKTALWSTADTIGPVHDRIISRLMFGEAKLEEIHKARAARASRTVGAVTGCGPLCLSVDHFYWERATPGTGTGCTAGEIVGRDTILGHATIAFQDRWTEHGRMTVWMAADLGCFALRSVYETQQADGTFRRAGEKRAVKITSRQ
ncbi:MAG TPA: hypothetical protein VG297_22930 [Bryobacteraceae bacterium]|nr:hypothetical protein [Bryobacteraceae bacterium]